MEYTLIRSRRKTLCVQLSAQGEVIVRAPQRCPRHYIDQFVESKGDWIETHRAQVLHTLAQREQFAFRTGDSLSFCGRTLWVKLAPGMKPCIHGDTLYLPDGHVAAIQGSLLKTLNQAARPWLVARLDHWAAVMDIDYRELKASTAATRWGSCTRDGVIRISAYLLLTPEKDIDYVLVHELAHRRVFAHNRAFWALVAAYLPDWQARRADLKREGQRLRAMGFGK